MFEFLLTWCVMLITCLHKCTAMTRPADITLADIYYKMRQMCVSVSLILHLKCDYQLDHFWWLVMVSALSAMTSLIMILMYLNKMSLIFYYILNIRISIYLSKQLKNYYMIKIMLTIFYKIFVVIFYVCNNNCTFCIYHTS